MKHWRRLEQLYREARCNAYYRPEIRIGDGVCEIEVVARDEFHHAMNGVHGSVYFKMLDDAGYFAVSSLVPDTFVLTSDFTIHLLRPVAEGLMLAKGRVVNAGARQFFAEAQLFGAGDKLLAHGVGTYVRGKVPIAGD